jgi:AbiV family abortive infection protein
MARLDMTSTNPYVREKALRLHRDCIDNARRLLDAAERLLVGDQPLANVAFHLATLALEEVAKAGLVLSLSLRTTDADTDWTVKRFDDHEAKLMWALWTPAIGLKPITREQMEKTWKAARRIHDTRLQAVYVNAKHDADPEQVPAKAITWSISHADVLKSRVRLRLIRLNSTMKSAGF